MFDAIRHLQATILNTWRIDPKQFEHLRAVAESASNYGPFLTHLANRGWGVPAHSLAGRNYNVALAETEYDFLRAEERVADYYESIAQRMVQGIAAQPALSHLKTGVEDAGKAHAESRYALAVPIWLISIDATVSALRSRKSLRKAKTFSAIAEAKYRRFFQSLFGGVEGHRLRGLLGTTLSRMGRQDYDADALAPTVNRNSALHGLRCYGERNDSLRVLSVLFALIDDAIYDEVNATKETRNF